MLVDVTYEMTSLLVNMVFSKILVNMTFSSNTKNLKYNSNLPPSKQIANTQIQNFIEKCKRVAILLLIPINMYNDVMIMKHAHLKLSLCHQLVCTIV